MKKIKPLLTAEIVGNGRRSGKLWRLSRPVTLERWNGDREMFEHVITASVLAYSGIYNTLACMSNEKGEQCSDCIPCVSEERREAHNAVMYLTLAWLDRNEVQVWLCEKS